MNNIKKELKEMAYKYIEFSHNDSIDEAIDKKLLVTKTTTDANGEWETTEIKDNLSINQLKELIEILGAKYYHVWDGAEYFGYETREYNEYKNKCSEIRVNFDQLFDTAIILVKSADKKTLKKLENMGYNSLIYGDSSIIEIIKILEKGE